MRERAHAAADRWDDPAPEPPPVGRLSVTQRHVARLEGADRTRERAILDAAWTPVQLARDTHTGLDDDGVQRAAARGTSGAATSLPYLDVIQRAFGHHDVSGVAAHFGGEARAASAELGAHAYATGDRVAFADDAPDLFLVAHEAAHVVQQRGGVQLSSAVGHAGDAYELHADAVADRVVRGESAVDLLDAHATGGATAGVFRREKAKQKSGGTPPAIAAARMVIWFPLDSATPRTDAADASAVVTRAMARAAEMEKKGDAKAVVTLHGYASEDGGEAHNNKLSRQRAEAIEQLARAAGAKVTLVLAHGEDASFADPEWNRRVEIEVSAQSTPAAKTAAPSPLDGGESPGSGYKIFVIGSPGPGEIDANHPLQFAMAAYYRGVDDHTVWIVEQTGYELGAAHAGSRDGTATNDLYYLDQLAELAPNGIYLPIRPDRSLTTILAGFPPASIQSMTVFSHGLAGALTLRHGWDDQGYPDYGLDSSEVGALKKEVFAPDASIDFQSCNTGSREYGVYKPLAQQIANQVGRPVSAWTGRTSYREVNNGDADGNTEVGPSKIKLRDPWDAVKETWSTYGMGRDPEHVTFAPELTPAQEEEQRVHAATGPIIRDEGLKKIKAAIEAARSTTEIDAIVAALDDAAAVGPDAQGFCPVNLASGLVWVHAADVGPLRQLATEALE